MKNFAIATVIAALQIAVAVPAFAGALAAAPRSQTAATAPGFAATGLAGFTQAKGAKPATAVSGAVSARLLNEYAAPAAGQSTLLKPDARAFSGLVGAATPTVSGMLGQKTNALLSSGVPGLARK